MKARQGFVSNSSSASFIVNVQMSQHELCEILIKELGWVNLNRPTFKTTILNDIKKYKEIVERNKQELKNLETQNPIKVADRIRFTKNSIEDWEKVVKNCTDLLDKIDKYKIEDYNYNGEEDYLQYLIDVLKYHHVHLEPHYEGWAFSAWTSMFNSYEDMPALLKELVLMFAFKNCKMKCKVVEDG